MFIQLHALTSYPSTLLNRDDAGFAKQLPFGGATRTRVSSQCLKYHWRNFDGENALYDMDVPKSLRSRETFWRRLAQPLIDDGYPAPLVHAVTFALKERLLSDDKAGKRDLKTLIDPDEDDDPRDMIDTSQVTIFGVPEMRYLRDLAAGMIEEAKDDFPVFWDKDGEPDSDAVKDAADAMRDISKRDLKKNLKGLELASGLDAAMFGRMATSDVLARGDAAVHVAHAFTTHAQESESDYFSAVDELRRDEPEESGELGAGHINTQELTSGLFYSYVVVDVPLLVSNLSGVEQDEWTDGNTALAAEVMERFAQLMATVSPGAKLGSTAPYSYAQCLFAEAGTAQPRTLANAFQTPAPTQNVLENSYEKLGRYVDEIDQMYGVQTDRRLAAMGPTDGLTDRLKVDDTTTVPTLAEWTANQIQTA
ncbi:type I-E CRISPR-associated protein Cas7/Cse4/CasC [Salinibacter sp.]|uniref:type I-E CRISPR-associated protein Cas7/Cse4/CasC n=1 Tax=Salinibacter sp. TaxID=2065818 RepID=UPI0021E74606|nr:type I-E CRISPR-associated protein Cas7/Cse4/CasC [Salinibacter sp.]